MRRDIDSELLFHLSERADQLRDEGLDDEQATRRARLQFGSPIVQAERTRDVEIALWIDALLRTLRHAAYAIARTPGFTATVVVTLAVVSLLCTTILLTGPATQSGTTNVEKLVRAQLQLSDSEWSELKRGIPVVKTLPASTKKEMVTTGGVHIRNASLGDFVGQFKTLEGFRTSPFVLQIGRFSEDPQLHDLDPLIVDADDIVALRGCRVGNCKVQLSASDIGRFTTEVNWQSVNATHEATALYKSILFTHLTEYRTGGAARLIQYHDHPTPMPLSAATIAILDARPSLLHQAPAFHDHIRHYPSQGFENAEGFFYWSKEAFGFKPVIGLNHVSVYTAAGTGEVMIATTQIYASHYMEGSVAINVLFPDPTGDGSDFFWLYSNRSRIGRLGGLLGALSRPVIQRRVRAGLTRSFVQTKERLEAAGKSRHVGAPESHD